MRRKSGQGASLKWSLFITVSLCWVVPILLIVTLSAVLLRNNYDKQLNKTLEVQTDHAMDQVELRLNSAIEASKAVSYDGVVRTAYRAYLDNGNQVELYSSITDYLTRAFARSPYVQAVFITFLDQPDQNYNYVVDKGMSSYGILEDFRRNIQGKAMRIAADTGMGISFTKLDGQLYMIRTLMDRNLQPYGVLTMLCNTDTLFHSLRNIDIPGIAEAEVELDQVVLPLSASTEAPERNPLHLFSAEVSAEVANHDLTYRAQIVRSTIWDAMPGLRWAVLLLLLLVVPVLVFVVLMFYLNVTNPVETLVSAANRVQAGERGYTIDKMPRNREFTKLTRQFNEMSTELKNQFDQLYLEQQALQEARIKALQSQINPHFLGNTLEIINWEARLAENDKVSAMIEALSTMLDGAIGRDGRARIPLKEELSYVDAYLYIVQQRIGDGLVIRKEIQDELLVQTVPRLLLQPLVENAVEHDLSQHRGGELVLRVYQQNRSLCLEVEHEGSISEQDAQHLSALLSTSPEDKEQRGKVGIRNLNQRLKLIYGQQGRLTIREIESGRILAQIQLPLPVDDANLCKVSK